MEFVLRTSSKDGDWIGQHPEWFYWIREDVPGSSARQQRSDWRMATRFFRRADLVHVKEKVARTISPICPRRPKSYREMFTPPPRPDQVHMEDGHWVGVLDDGTRVRIPGAFADWPPDDNQPPWTDVTYLRMYDHPDFNYIAYNTIRMYDVRLATPENAVAESVGCCRRCDPALSARIWDRRRDDRHGARAPYAAQTADCQHARATINPDFAFWDENFLIEQKSVDEGYNAVMGYHAV